MAGTVKFGSEDLPDEVVFGRLFKLTVLPEVGKLCLSEVHFGVPERGFAGEGDVAKYIKRSAPSSSLYPFEAGRDCVGVLSKIFGVPPRICFLDNTGVL